MVKLLTNYNYKYRDIISNAFGKPRVFVGNLYSVSDGVFENFLPQLMIHNGNRQIANTLIELMCSCCKLPNDEKLVLGCWPNDAYSWTEANFVPWTRETAFPPACQTGVALDTMETNPNPNQLDYVAYSVAILHPDFAFNEMYYVKNAKKYLELPVLMQMIIAKNAPVKIKTLLRVWCHNPTIAHLFGE